MVTIRSRASETWQRGFYKKVSRKMKLLGEEFEEEIDCLKGMVDGLRSVRKQLLTERHD